MGNEQKNKPHVPDKADDKEQSERFIDAAKRVGATHEEADFERAFKGVVRSPKDHSPPKKRRGS